MKLVEILNINIEKMLKEIAEHDELTLELIKTFEEYQKDLKDELDSWLRGIDVTE